MNDLDEFNFFPTIISPTKERTKNFLARTFNLRADVHLTDNQLVPGLLHEESVQNTFIFVLLFFLYRLPSLLLAAKSSPC